MVRQNRITSRRQFAALVKVLERKGILGRVHEIVVEREFETDYEQMAALLDLLNNVFDFPKKQVLLLAICMAFFEVGRGNLNRDATFDEYINSRDRKAN